ncbi:MAG: hypothetical protein HY855_07520 [Burkholderiales bacterium]|nr:hypothetical protein [Burkholderiales bacterium]
MPTPPPRRLLAAPVALLLAGVLLSGLVGGLQRAGAVLPGWAQLALPAPAAALHAALMISGFFGSVIGVERAVALKWRPAWAAPLASLLGAWALLAGAVAAGAWLLVAASAAFTVASGLIVRRQRAAHTVLLALAALCWLGGNLRFALGGFDDTTLAAWFAFLVLTITAERLEMARLMRHQPIAQASCYALVALLVVALPLTALAPRAGGLLYGFALMALAGWLGLYDIARRTVHSFGLARYMAVCLLGGYAWLGLAGAAWAAMATGAPTRDAALHALGLGFIVSMVMGHAPVILPAVTGLKLHFSAVFYAPLALLHASLLLRLGGGLLGPAWRVAGATLNLLAIASFALTAVWAAFAWRSMHDKPGRRTDRPTLRP